jgi:hypothetical protein
MINENWRGTAAPHLIINRNSTTLQIRLTAQVEEVRVERAVVAKIIADLHRDIELLKSE